MIVQLTRVGVPAIARRDDGTWKAWAYEDAVRQACGPLEAPVFIIVQPTCPDKRGVAAAGSYWQVVEQMIDGLLSAGVLRSADDIREITLRRTEITKELSVSMTLTDANEPF